MNANRFLPGSDVLLNDHREWLHGLRIGLVSHLAALNAAGATTAEAIRNSGLRLSALFGPEHGYFGLAMAGEETADRRHPWWHISIHSLYGKTRKPTAAMLRGIDVLVFDLQDLGARPYTYVSTLRYVLEAAATHGVAVIVADRPVPLPRITDGPLLDLNCESFVSCIRAPMSYGMTPGETSLWLKHDLALDVNLKVARMRNYRRQGRREPDWPPWIPPSPGIRSWETAACYPATVFCEALPAVDCGRGTALAFQVIGSQWLRGDALCESMSGQNLPGVAFHPHPYVAACGPFAGRLLDGVRMVVTNPDVFQPIRTSVSILAELQTACGKRRIWRQPDTRPEFFDKLFGTSRVREALLDGETAKKIAGGWQRDLPAFRRARKPCLLY